jgi:hypothetical protein
VNKDLYNKPKGQIEFPKEKREHMKICFQKIQGADENTEGFNRNQELQGQSFIDYKQLKRIKNFFDNFKGNQNEASFILNGGALMKNWVEDELRKMRDYTKMTKRNKMDTGISNRELAVDLLIYLIQGADEVKRRELLQKVIKYREIEGQWRSFNGGKMLPIDRDSDGAILVKDHNLPLPKN